MLLVVAAVAYYYAGGYAAKVSAMKTEAVSLVSHSSKDTFRKNQTSIAYDVNGNMNLRPFYCKMKQSQSKCQTILLHLSI